MSDKSKRPPQWIKRLIERYCDPHLFEGISGDLEELFFENVALKGHRRAKWIYIMQILGFFKTRFRKRSKKTSNMKAIWANYFLISWRSLQKHKFYFGINLLGLILAITCSLLAIVYINDEFQFDRQHTEGDQIYRLYKRYINVPEGVDHLTYETSGMMGITMKEEYPEVEDFVRVLPWWHKVTLSYKKTNITSENLYFADANFFNVFDFDVVEGDASSFLEVPSSIVLTESLAKKIFNEENPIGKTVLSLGYNKYKVTGIIKDPPRQSSFEFEALISWSTTEPGRGPLNWSWMNNWLAQGIYTFVKLSKDASPSILVDKLPEMMNRHFEERADQYFLKLIPLEKMHLYGDHIRGSERMNSGSITFIYTLGFSAFLIFLIASVNYINISLSRSTRTQSEVGIRKVMGSTRRQLAERFISETFIYSFLASIISLFLIYLLLPLVNNVSGKELPFNTFLTANALLYIIGFIVGTSLLVGLYPAFVLSSPPLSTILKSSSGQVSSTAGWLKKILLSLQYAISVFLIICTVTIIKQIQFLENKPLGFDKEQVMILNVGNEVGNKADLLEEELLKHPNIISISTSRSTMGDGSYSTTVIPEGYNDELNTRIFGVDQEFFETFNIKTVLGRTFLKGSLADSNQLVINEAMAEFMGWDDPIGKHIRFSEDSPGIPIIGVIEDFHIHSLATNTIEPMLIYLDTQTNWYTAVKIGNGDMKETISYVSDTWDKFARRTPFDFHFIDDWFNDQYKKERKMLRITTIYSIISIILCTLGLYGLTALHLQHRMKEISIRKVLGAPVSSIIAMMNKQFLLFIFFSFIVAIPLAWYFVEDWLEQFAYRISLDIQPFTISTITIVILSSLVVSILALRSASVNPSTNLRSE